MSNGSSSETANKSPRYRARMGGNMAGVGRLNYAGTPSDKPGPMDGRLCRCEPGCQLPVQSHNKLGVHALHLSKWRRLRQKAAVKGTFA